MGRARWRGGPGMTRVAGAGNRSESVVGDLAPRSPSNPCLVGCQWITPRCGYDGPSGSGPVLSLGVAQQAGDQFGAVGHTEFGQDVVDVAFDGSFAQDEAIGDLPVGECF